MATSTVNRIPSPSLNGHSPKKRVAKQPSSSLRETHLRTIITISMGVGIPLLSLSLSHLGGALLLTSDYTLAVALFLITAAVLGVSLSHLAWSIRDITKSGRAASWALAISIDVSLIVCELTAVNTSANIIIIRAVMVSVTAFSMALNCWAFLKHR